MSGFPQEPTFPAPNGSISYPPHPPWLSLGHSTSARHDGVPATGLLMPLGGSLVPSYLRRAWIESMLIGYVSGAGVWSWVHYKGLADHKRRFSGSEAAGKSQGRHISAVWLQEGTRRTVWPDTIADSIALRVQNVKDGAVQFVDMTGDDVPDLLVIGEVSTCVGLGSASAVVYPGGRGGIDTRFGNGVTLWAGADSAADVRGGPMRVDALGPSGMYVLSQPVSALTLFRNVGNGTVETTTVFPVSYIPVQPLARADVNGDGCDDMFLCVRSSNSSFCEYLESYCNSSYAFVERTGEVLPEGVPPAGGGSSQLFCDYTGDGLVDLIAIQSSGAMAFENRGNGSFWTNSNPGLPSQDQRRFIVGAFHGQPLLDVLLFAPSDPPFFAYAGNGSFVDRSVATLGMYSSTGLADDSDGDGVEELLLAAGPANAVFSLNASSVFSVRHTFNGAAGANAVASAHIGQYLAVFFARSGVTSQYYLSAGLSWQPDSMASNFGDTEYPYALLNPAVSLADFTGDGCPDLCVIGTVDYTGEIKSEVLRGTCSGSFIGINIVLEELERARIHWADFDGNGMLDLLEMGQISQFLPRARLRFQSGAGDIGSDEFVARCPGANAVAAPLSAIGDFDASGAPDFAYCGASVRVLALNLGNGSFAVQQAPVLLSVLSNVAVFSPDPQLAERFVYIDRTLGISQLNVAPNGSAVPTPVALPAYSFSLFVLGADFDGDGAGDLLFHADRETRLAFSLANESFTVIDVLPPVDSQWFSFAVASYRMPDSVRRGAVVTGMLGLARSMAVISTHSNQTASVSFSGGNYLPAGEAFSEGAIAFADIDGDDIDDVVLAGQAASCGLKVFLSTMELPTGGGTSGSTSTADSSADSNTDGQGGLSWLAVLVGTLSASVGVAVLMCVAVAASCLCLVCAFIVLAFGTAVVLAVVAVVLGITTALAGVVAGGSGSALLWRNGVKDAPDLHDMDDLTTADVEVLAQRVEQTKSVRRISPDDVVLLSRIGEGSFGSVFLGEWAGARVAVKIVSAQLTPEVIDSFEFEAIVMAKVSHHPHVVQLIGVCVEPEKLAMVLRFSPGGSLDMALLKGKFDAAEKRRVLCEVAGALAFLHSVGTIHRDVAARNVLLDDGMSAKLADLGLARVLEKGSDEQSTKSMVGPVRWMAPEALTQQRYSGASDAWSFGVLMWEVWSNGATPYGDMKSVADVATAIVCEGKRLVLPTDCPTEHVSLIRRLLVTDPADRPSMQDVNQQLAKNSPKNNSAELSGAQLDVSDEYFAAEELVQENAN